MTFKLLTILTIPLLFISSNQTPETSVRTMLSLEGNWQFSMDPAGQGLREKWYNKMLSGIVKLPGTMDENGKGMINHDTAEIMRLSRERTYAGRAWYRKEVIIPESWQGRIIRLKMERTKPSEIWVDSIYAGSSSAILTPQVYDLTKQLTPGKHYLTIMVNNGSGSVPEGITSSHAWTEHTQTNWNGIIGEFFLEALDPDHFVSVMAFPDISSKSFLIKAKIMSSGESDKKARISIKGHGWNLPGRHNGKPGSFTVQLKPGMNEIELTYKPGRDIRLWSEFDPALYRLSLSMKEGSVTDNLTIDLGMRFFSTRGTQFTINDIVTFLRGKHDACVFPLTGHPPMDVESWLKVFRTAKSYNINFYRFHSWTPPEAAFEAADIEGIYLQPELPFWGSLSKNDTSGLNEFLIETGDRILQEYGNHASFVMFALGNELSGDQRVMKSFTDHFRSIDNRHLMAFGSNNYLGFRGQAKGEDYYAGCRIGKDPGTSFSTHIRGSFSFADAYDGGYINGSYPSSDRNYEGAISKCSVPATGTEVGQYQVYPDFNEIRKYVGVLKPWNLITFRKRLEQNNLSDQAMDFSRASGALSMICYRADIEMALRTPGFGGFHLLDLQDFPGQGTALVGILDAFMESKGLITPEEFSHFCNKVVPLFVTDKFCLTNTEKLTGRIEVANYSERDLDGQNVTWSLAGQNNEILARGNVTSDFPQGKLTNAARIDIGLSNVIRPEKTVLRIKLEGTGYENSYPLWIYPENREISVPEGITISTKLDKQTIDVILNGGKVLLFPEFNDIMDQSAGGLFTTDYWNYRMFRGISESQNRPVSPGTMGILTDPSHPLFDDFPTGSHSDWQWWSIVKNSRPLILDRTPAGYKPVIQVIDNIERNHKLGLVFEFRLGAGKILVCMSDLRLIQDRPEARQFYSSILDYMASDKFKPLQDISASDLVGLF